MLDWVCGFTCTREVLKRLDRAAAARAAGRLREALAAHLGDDGVWFSSRAWIVTAHRTQRAAELWGSSGCPGVPFLSAGPRGARRGSGRRRYIPMRLRRPRVLGGGKKECQP